MKQKKALWFLLAFFMVSTMSLGFVSCGDDDDDDDSDATSTKAIGTWKGNSIKDPEALTLTFKSNGKGTWEVEYIRGTRAPGNEHGSFMYKTDGKSKGIITVKDVVVGNFEFENGKYYFKINGNEMDLYEDDYGEDLKYILIKQ